MCIATSHGGYPQNFGSLCHTTSNAHVCDFVTSDIPFFVSSAFMARHYLALASREETMLTDSIIIPIAPIVALQQLGNATWGCANTPKNTQFLSRNSFIRLIDKQTISIVQL